MNWKEKKVLVTGSGGFIGSHLAEMLVSAGARVTAFTHYNALDSRGWLNNSRLAPEMELLAGDITDPDSVEHAVSGQEFVFHLAALIPIPYSYRAPRSYIRTNVEGTVNVLQAARRHNVSRVLHTSTSEVYGTARTVPITESHPLQGQSPYSASKIGADKMAEAFHASFDLPVVTVRPFNTFGPRQSARAVIPTIILQLLAGDAVRLGSLSPTRDLNYVANTAAGFMKAAVATEAPGHAINLGSGREISIGDLAQLIAKLMNRPIRIETGDERLRPENSEVNRLLADASLARQLLNWEAEISLEDGLRHTIGWIEENRELFRGRDYVL
jgi:NAD dependent epimerase/dehydratase